MVRQALGYHSRYPAQGATMNVPERPTKLTTPEQMNQDLTPQEKQRFVYVNLATEISLEEYKEAQE